MRQILGIFVFIATFSFVEGQTPSAYEMDIAMKVGLCGDDSTYPCKECKFKYISLLPGQANDQLFFLEAVSPIHCGSGGCTGTVYLKKGDEYQEILHVFGFFDRTISGKNAIPDIIYLHVEFPKRDYNQDGKKDKASIRVRYRWNAARQAFDLIDILEIDVYGQDIDPEPWRKILIREWQSNGSPWVN